MNQTKTPIHKSQFLQWLGLSGGAALLLLILGTGFFLAVAGGIFLGTCAVLFLSAEKAAYRNETKSFLREAWSLCFRFLGCAITVVGGLCSHIARGLLTKRSSDADK